MTDFGAPTTPAEALRQHADDCRYRAERARRDAAELTNIAETWEEARRTAEDDADQYDRWQPKPETEETS